MIDSQGREWNVFEREDGSITVYYTRKNEAVHYVVYDTLDRQPTKRAADGGNAARVKVKSKAGKASKAAAR